MLAQLLLATVVLWTQVEAPNGQALRARVLDLVRQMDAAEKTARDEAEQKLLAMGDAALDWLPQLDEQAPAEVRERLGRVRTQLERARAESTVQATMVSLSGEMPLSEAVKAIVKQTGNKIIDFRESVGQETKDPKLKMSLEKVPFWTAVDQVLDQAELTIYSHAGEDGLAFYSRTPGELPRAGRATTMGAFRLEPTDFAASRDLRNPNSHQLLLGMELSWEPRLKPLVLLMPLSEVDAIDEKGNPLPLAGAESELEIPITSDMHAVDLSLGFELPPRTVQKMAKLKGKVMALLPGRVEEFRFAQLAEGGKKIEQRKGGVRVVLDRVGKNNELFEFRIRVAFDNAQGAFQSHRGWVTNNEAYVESPTKEVIPFAASEETAAGEENEVGMNYLFDLPAGLKGHTLIYKTPAAVVSVPIQYELKDLQLP